jgi:Integrase
VEDIPLLTTDRQIASLKPRETVYWESVKSPHGGGLAIRISVRGTKTWSYRFRFRGKQDAVSLGRYPTTSLLQARDVHGEACALLAKGINPKKAFKESKKVAEQTWTGQELFDDWIRVYSSTPSTRTKRTPSEQVVRQTTWRWNKYLRRTLGQILIPTITKQAAASLISAVSELNSREQARKCLTILNGMFELAVAKGLIDENPCYGLQPAKLGASKGSPRSRVLTPSEIKWFWEALEDSSLDTSVRAALKAILLTGLRRGEICQAKWSDIDFNTNVWNLPPEITKSRRKHTVPISTALKNLLQSLDMDGTYVFRSTRAPWQPIGSNSLTTAIARLQGIKTQQVNEKAPLFGLERFSVHDLRRTVATGLGEYCETPPHVIRRILNHLSDDRLEDIYQRATLFDEQAKALERWSTWVMETVEEG